MCKDQIIKIIKKYGNEPQQLIAILLDIQAESGKNYIEKQWAKLVSAVLDVPLSKTYEILTFYAMFNTEPCGEYIIEICKSTPCYFSKNTKIVQWFETAVGIRMGETTADGKISLFYTSCVGACDISPVVKIGDDVFGNLTEEKVKMLVKRCREGEPLCEN